MILSALHDLLPLYADGVDGAVAPVSTQTLNPSDDTSLESLLARARTMNPDIVATALEANAVRLRAQQADTLPDPTLQVTLDEISRNGRGLPGRVDAVIYAAQQTLPWWGKRALRRAQADAEVRTADSLHDERLADVLMQIKTTYADYQRVQITQTQIHEIARLLTLLADAAHARYTQGIDGQAALTAIHAEQGTLAMERIRLEHEQQRIQARLNALVNRPADALLHAPTALRVIPPAAKLGYPALLERGLATYPALRTGQARIGSAAAEQQLAQRDAYPDVTLGVGVVERRDPDMPDGFEAMVAVSLPVPWGRQPLVQREMATRQQVAHEQFQAARLQVESGLKQALSSLEEARKVGQILQETVQPQARLTLEAAIRGYEAGTLDIAPVLEAAQKLHRLDIEQIQAAYDQQVRLAEIERFVGDDL
jgi:cobalt-zinc-cadmium efflux system outer membrane protein